MKFTITYAPIVLLLSLGVQSCGGAEDAGLTGENTDPEGGGASNGGGANAGGTSGGGNSNGGGTNTGGAGDASGGGSAGTGGASDGTEDCLNGRDDDGDGGVDCADDDCVAVSCVAEAPEGWSGPIAFRDVDNAAADGLVCPDSFPAVAFEAGGDLDVEPATCSACECEVTADQCQAQLLSFGGSCGNNAQSDPVQSECTALGLGQFGFDAAYVGGCSVGNSQPALPTAEWGSRSIGCEATALGGGCAERSTCAPELSADTRLCVYREGDASCTDQYPGRCQRI